MKKRIISLILVFSVVCALSAPAFAVNNLNEIGYDTQLDTSSAMQWRDMIDHSPFYEDFLDPVGKVIETFGGDYWVSPAKPSYAIFDNTLTSYGFGETSISSLRQVAGAYQNEFRFTWDRSNVFAKASRLTTAERLLKNLKAISGRYLWFILNLQHDSDAPVFRVQLDSERNVYRIKETTTNRWITDSVGRFLCAKNPEVGDIDTDKWVQSSTLDNQLAEGSVQFRMTSKAALEGMRDSLGAGVQLRQWHEYIVVVNLAAGNSRSVPIRCNADGNIYACWYDENTAAVNTPRTTTDIENVDGADDLNQTNDSTEINYNGMTIVLPDGDFNIGEINYNSNNKTYNIEAYKYDITNNYYYTYNYSWTYHINYTSITYIGQSEEYDRTYNLYYQLPDGRSSADLTAEELEQLNLAVDVINYGRSADDTRLRSLYHFDGNTDDASYWNYCTAFSWNQGASLTYLESGNFNGALYLDETDHDFTLTLPSALGSNDFTFQFRYYQSATAAPQNDSYIRFASTDLMRFNGSQILNGSGTVLSTMPIGTWNELAIIRESGTVRYYLNGVQLGTISNTTAFNAAVTFHFGSSQQTYKELDELRVLNYALTSGGASYTPTSVPHDTNLALVLPDSVVPVADEYWDIHNDSQTNLLSQYHADWWDVERSPLTNSYSGVYKFDSNSYQFYSNGYSFSYYLNTVSSHISKTACYDRSEITNFNGLYLLNDSFYSVSVGSRLQQSSDYLRSSCSYPSQGVFYYPAGDALIQVGYFSTVSTSQSLQAPLSGFHTISIVDTSGIVHHLTFSPVWLYSNDWNSFISDKFVGNIGNSGYSLYLTLCRAYGWDNRGNGISADRYFLSIRANNSSPSEIIYMELVEGDHTDLSAELVSSITLMDSASLNTPTLAVRSDIPVTNYQIGGVRPSIPYKGLVWAMVESGYISSLQIYDGRAWVQCDGRIWTGERWIPYSSYNVVTLSDMYDIADASGQSGYEYIYSESGFWSWFQKAWLDFRQWTSTMLSTVQGLGTGGGSGGEAPITMDDLSEVNGSDWDLSEDSSMEDGSFIGAIRTAGSGTWHLLRLTFGHMLNIFNNVGKSGEVLSAPFDNDSPDYAFGYFVGGG